MPDPDREDDGLRNYLTDRDVSCPACGYNLRGLRESHCPECNQQLRLTVALHDAYMVRLVAAVVPPAAFALMVGTILFVILLIQALQWDWRLNTLLRPLPLFAIIAATCLAVPSWWLTRPRGRLWFARMPPQSRNRIVACSWLATGVSFAGCLWIGFNCM